MSLKWKRCCNIQKLLLLDILFFIFVACFFYFKRCVLSIISNKLINNPNDFWISPIDRISYLFNINKPYKLFSSNKNNTELWMNGSISLITIIILLNVYCLWKISSGTSCIPIIGFNIFKQNSRRNYFKK